jgi:hypothetical protein
MMAYHLLGKKSVTKSINMKLILLLLISLPVLGISQVSTPNKKGKIQIERLRLAKDSSIVTGVIYDYQTHEQLKLCDFWINNKRYDCDTLCNFFVFLRKGRYVIEARSFGYENFKYKFRIQENERISFKFYLVPYQNITSPKSIH